DQVAWIRRLDTELDNVRSVLTWLRSTESATETGLRLVGALGDFWVRRGYRNEGRAWLADMLVRPGTPTIPRARALCQAGFLAWYQSEVAQAVTFLEESRALYRELEDTIGSGWTLYQLGHVASDQDDFGRAATLFDESRALFRQRGYVSGSAWVLLGMGMLAVEQRHIA